MRAVSGRASVGFVFGACARPQAPERWSGSRTLEARVAACPLFRVPGNLPRVGGRARQTPSGPLPGAQWVG